MASHRSTAAPSPGHDNSSLNFLLAGRGATADGLGLGYHHHPQVPQPSGGEEYRKGQALECALFSSIAIGGLMLGCPVGDVARHLVAAQRCREQLDGLKERSAVSALLLHAVSHAFLGAEKAPPGAKPSSSSEAEYRQSMDDAAAIDAELPDKDPLATAFMAYRKVLDCTSVLTVEILTSSNPVNAAIGSQGAAALGVKTEGGRLARERISTGCRERHFTPAAPKAHPAFVSSDGHFLALRHANSIWGGGAGYIHVHDYLVFELGRFVAEEGTAGAAVLATLGSLLIGAKALTAQLDDLLPLAELVSRQYHQFPGFARYDKCIIGYNALAVFRLLGRRGQYTSLRNIMVTRGDNSLGHTPTFDELAPGVPICRSEVIIMSTEMILNPRSGGGGGGPGGGGGGMTAPSMGRFPTHSLV